MHMCNDRRFAGRAALAFLAVVVFAVVVGGCDDAGDDPEGEPEGDSTLGLPCASDVDCEGGTCLRGAATHDAAQESPFCTHACSDDSDCAAGAGMTCGTGPGGASVCTPPCAEPNGFACVDGETVACSVAQDPPCGQCGCPDDLVCGIDPAVCAPRASVGTACTADRDCMSDNCGATGLCRVALGAECTVDDCDLCIALGAWSACSRPCDDPAQCDGLLCTQPPGAGEATCRPVCDTTHDDACPVACHIADDDEVSFYCRCDECSLDGVPPADSGMPMGDASMPEDDGGMLDDDGGM